MPTCDHACTEAQIRAVLAGPDYMDCPAGKGARIPKAVCVKRQEQGLLISSFGDREVPWSCMGCAAGRKAIEEQKKGGEAMGKKASNPQPPVARKDRPAPPPAPPHEGDSDLRSALKKVFHKGIWVDFTGREDLLERFKAEAAQEKETPEEHALWLIGVYLKGLKRTARDVAAKV